MTLTPSSGLSAPVGSASMKPTMSTPSACRRSMSSRSSLIAAATSTDEQQPLPRADAVRQPLESHTPSGHEHRDETRGQKKHAAANHRRREPVVHRRQDERSPSQRLNDADQPAPCGRRAAENRRGRNNRDTTGRPPQSAAPWPCRSAPPSPPTSSLRSGRTRPATPPR